MNQHPGYYTALVHRRAAPEDTLSAFEREELDLHLTICPRCAYDLAECLRPHDPAQAGAVMSAMQERLSADLVTPYLHDLAVAVGEGRPLDDFQRLLWQHLLRDREAMGYYRVAEADVWLRESQEGCLDSRLRRSDGT